MGAITYNINIPQATDQISQSQALILQNFQGINSLVAVDHATFASANAGWHNQVTFVGQASDASTTSTQFAMYNKLVASVPTMFLRQPSNGAAIDFTTINIAGGPNLGGWTYLPSGLLLKWGQFLYSSGVTNQTFNWPTGSPNYATCYYINVTPVFVGIDPNVAVYPSSFGATDFVVNAYNRMAGGNPANFNFYYIAIGV